MNMNKSLVGVGILLLGMISIQYGASVAKNLFSLSGIAGATTLRLIFASLCLLLITRPWRKPFKKEYLLPITLYGLSLGLMNLTFYFSLARIPLGIAVALEFTGPLFLAAISSQRKADYLWVLFAGLGIYFLLPQTGHSELDPWGVFFALLAGAFWALYIIFGKRLSSTIPTKLGITYGMSVAALVVLPFGLTFDFSKMIQSEVILPSLIVGVFGSSIPYALELRAMKSLSQKSFSILMSLEPMVATIVGVIFLSEFLDWMQITAILCICIASLGTSLTPGPSHNS
ncbi:MAG TPA: DMT family transporter [Bacteriovoracaceae bacterium]|nr:DMT family transporter [Bacteriovoracaceae bacterium]